MITLADSGLSDVPSEFLKWFVVTAVAFVTLGISVYVAYRKGQGVSGTKAEPVNIAQPLDVRPVPEHAIKGDTRDELRSLDEKITASARENLRQHHATAERMSQIVKAGEERASTILKALHEMETRMTTATLKEIKDVHGRVNPLAERVQGHHESIKHLNTRVAELWEWICKIFDQLQLPRKSK